MKVVTEELEKIVDAIKIVRGPTVAPTYILANGKDMNAMAGSDIFPEDHVFEFKDNEWIDLTIGVYFKDMK